MSEPILTADGRVATINDPLPPRPSPAERAEAAWQRMRSRPDFSEALFGHLRPGLLQRVPLKLYGIATDGIGHIWWLYRDAAGNCRVLRGEEHDRAGIAGLFTGAEGWLGRLWPAANGGWDDERAAETLFFLQGCIGTVDACRLGFELPVEPWP